MAVKKSDIVICAGEGVSSLSCTGGRIISDFYDTFSIWGNGKSQYCKKCLDKIYDSYYKRSGNSDKVALYYTLLQINVPFITEVYSKLKSNNEKVTVFKYITEFNKNSKAKTKWVDFSCTDMKLVDSESEDLNKDEELEKLEKIWGVQDNKKDYEFLEDTYNEYTQDRDELSVAEINQYRWLCRDSLLLRKINDGSYDGEETIDKVQSRINKTMSILKIDKFEEKKKKSDIEKILEYQIWEIENTEPAEMVDKEEYKDYLDIHKDWGRDILRCVKNLLVNSKEYPNITRDSDKY